MQLADKRQDHRMPLSFYLNEYIDDQPQRCMGINVSTGGLFVRRLKLPDIAEKSLSIHPDPGSVVGLEFELPGTSERIWAAAKVCFDARQRYFQGTGLSFFAIAEMHRKLVRDYVLDHREKTLRQLLANVRKNRRRFAFN